MHRRELSACNLVTFTFWTQKFMITINQCFPYKIFKTTLTSIHLTSVQPPSHDFLTLLLLAPFHISSFSFTNFLFFARRGKLIWTLSAFSTFNTLSYYTLCPEKNDRQYFGRNFGKFRQLFTIFGTNHPDIRGDWKIVKSPITIGMTIRNDDVIVTSLKNAVFARRKRNARIDFVSTGFKSSWLQWVGHTARKVYKRRKTDLDDLKHCIRTEWAKLDHAIIAAAVHYWRLRLSGCVKTGGGHVKHSFWFWHCVCSHNCNRSCCRWPVAC